MGYKRNDKTKLVMLITLVAVLGMSIAFAAFSTSLSISSSANVTPDSGMFAVKFSSNSTKLETNNITPTGNGDAAIINNNGNPSISKLSAKFTSPGEKVVYKFYALNTGNYDAYLSSVFYDNATGSTSFKKCNIPTGTDSTMATSACNSIKVTTQVASLSFTGTQSDIENHVLKKGTSELVTITIEYPSSASVVDGPFSIDFGNIYLTYGSTELKGLPDLSKNKQICIGVESSTTYTIGTEDYEEGVSTKVPLGNYLPGDEYICQVNDSQTQHFIVMNTEGDKVNLLMTSNIDSTGTAVTGTTGTYEIVRWNSTWDRTLGPVSAMELLNKATSNWTNIPMLNETYNDEGGNFTNYKITGRARLPKVSEINNLGGLAFINSDGWHLGGYWTLSSSSEYEYAAEVVDGHNYGNHFTYHNDGYEYGVRPVITLSKSALN